MYPFSVISCCAYYNFSPSQLDGIWVNSLIGLTIFLLQPPWPTTESSSEMTDFACSTKSSSSLLRLYKKSLWIWLDSGVSSSKICKSSINSALKRISTKANLCQILVSSPSWSTTSGSWLTLSWSVAVVLLESSRLYEMQTSLSPRGNSSDF